MHALRRLLASPGFTLTALVTLALGIGVNTSMFSVLNTLFLRSLPYADSDRLVRVFRTSPQSDSWPHSAANFLDHQAQNQVFEGMAAVRWNSYSLAEPGQPAERLRAMMVTAEFFPLLGVQPVLGRFFAAAEDTPGNDKVVVLSHACWTSRFHGNPEIIGRTIRLSSEPVTVVGVMPPGFNDRMLWGHVEAWRPMAFSERQRQSRGNNYLNVVARLKPGVSLPQAQAGMNTIVAQLEKQYPQNNAQQGVRLVSLARSADEEGLRIAWFVTGIAGFVLLIACANLANLQFARTAGRAREYAIRTALGASRWRIVRDLLGETLLLGLAGGALGVVLALWCNDLLGRQIMIANQAGVKLPLDWRVLGFALAASVTTGFAFGLLPAWLASRANVGDALKQGSRGTTGSQAQHRLRHALIVGEVALALVLLAGAGFFVRGLQRFTDRDLGWQPEGIVNGYVALAGSKYSDDPKRRAFQEQLQAKLSALPGVEHASTAGSTPAWNMGSSSSFIVDGRPIPARGTEPLTGVTSVAPEYFATHGIQIISGRNFSATDRPDGPPVVIINETMARALWPGESAVGQRIGSADPENRNWREVIGVVRDVRAASTLSAPDTRFQLYRHIAQIPSGYLVLALRTRIAPEALAGELRRAVAELDPDQPVHDIATARFEIIRQMENYSLISWLLAIFAGLGVALAAVGIYGVISSFVVQRTSEIGLRMALGAQIRDVLALVLGKGLRLALLGTLLGLGGAYAIAKLLRAVMPELPNADPFTALGVTALLILVALVACWLPARRATKVDPMTALRAE